MIENFSAVPLLVQIFDKGRLIYELPSLKEIRVYAKTEHEKLWPEVLRLERPHQYYVDLSQKLWDLKQELIIKHRK